MNEPEELFPRLRTDLADGIHNIPPPPMPVVPSPYGSRLADPDADAEMIAEWMSRPHLARAWDQVWPASRWRRYLRAQLDGGYSLPFVGGIDGHDQAYVELYRPAMDLVSTRYESDSWDLGVRPAVADLQMLNTGIVLLLLPHFVASVFHAEPQCHRIMFDPEYRNKALREFCESGGCVFLGEHDIAHQRRALYVLPRTLDDIPRLLD